MYQWESRVHPAGLDISNPISGEYFADGQSRNAASALIREALQNALDAGREVERDGPVRVHIGVHTGSSAMSAEQAGDWFSSLRPHVQAKNNGLHGPPAVDEPCPFLVVEDFGTSGLTGEPMETQVDEGRNNFLDFMRGDGQTRKGEGERGSWGVGKNVFPRASRLNGFLAWTIRHDDHRRLAMGKAIYKVRRVDGEQRVPQCYLCAGWQEGQAPEPISDAGFEDRLRRAFSLTRQDEPGLSIVVPYIDEDIDFDLLAEAIAGEYFYAILAGSLEITLSDGDRSVAFDRVRIPSLMAAYAPKEHAMAALAAWSLSDPERLAVDAVDPRSPQKWSPELVPDDLRVQIRQSLQQNDRVALRVPVSVWPNAGSPQASHFDVYLEDAGDDDATGVPSFIRDQLSLGHVSRTGRTGGIRSLVVVDHKPIADMLRAAEPPSHEKVPTCRVDLLPAAHGRANNDLTLSKRRGFPSIGTRCATKPPRRRVSRATSSSRPALTQSISGIGAKSSRTSSPSTIAVVGLSCLG